ncbi:MAG TPA: hypothetical protein VG937_37015 [Polyangiaceae bacterium]|nr:hypothetical protein [Polyangiaceae bacterium]
MFVLLGPDFEGSNDAYQRLAQATGLVAYDLRARVRSGAWGVVKTLADEAQAESLARALRLAGFRPILIDRSVAHDPERRIVHVRDIELRETDFALGLRDRQMVVEYAALSCLVRGEVQPGRTAQRGSASGPSSATFRAVAAVETPSLRDPQSTFESYQAADLHFLSVPWVARIDLHSLGGTSHEASPRSLDALSDELGKRAGVRVDRSIRTSSVAALAEQSAPMRTLGSEPPGLREARREQADDRFDPYSRLIGEAERQMRAGARSNS